MGYLTTVTIRNDFLGSIEKNPKEFTEKIVSACHRMRGDENTYYGSDIIPQHTRHADDHTIYVHMGNTVVEMNKYSKECIELMKCNPEFFNRLLRFMKEQTKELNRLFNESKK